MDSSTDPPIPRLRRWIRTKLRPRQRIEKWYPCVAGFVGGTVGWDWARDTVISEALTDDVLPMATTVTAILAGFQASAQSVLLALIGNDVWAYLKRNGHSNRLLGYHWETIWTLFAFVALALIVLAIRATSAVPATPHPVLMGILIGLLAWSLMASHRICHIMYLILRSQ